MIFPLLVLAVMVTTSSAVEDDYQWRIRCDAIGARTNYCYISGLEPSKINQYRLDVIKTYPHEFDYRPCTSEFYHLLVHNNRAAIRVDWACHALFGVKLVLPRFPYKGKCGQNNYDFKIIDGVDAKECQFPWMVHVTLEWNSGYHASCGGSIINNRWILTAAHCVILQGGNGRLPPPHTMYVITGSLNEKVNVKRRLKSLVTHPLYENRHLTHDIALLELAEPIKWDGCHAPVCLNQEKDVDKTTNLTCMISGWGSTHTIYNHGPDTLMWGYDRILPRRDCNVIYNKYSNEHTLCGSKRANGNGVFCRGDSGGPLVCKSRANGRFYQHGVVSRYFSDTECRMEGLYESVAGHYDWIKRTVVDI